MSQATPSHLTSGQCLCGNISYTINADPVRKAQCHCKQCQRMSGGGHMSLAFFPAEAVQIEGTPATYEMQADSGNTKTRHFCAQCGVGLFGTNSARAGVMSVAVGTAEDHAWFEPDAIVYSAMRPGWDITSESVPNFEAMPPAPK